MSSLRPPTSSVALLPKLSSRLLITNLVDAVYIPLFRLSARRISSWTSRFRGATRQRYNRPLAGGRGAAAKRLGRGLQNLQTAFCIANRIHGLGYKGPRGLVYRFWFFGQVAKRLGIGLQNRH